MTFGISCGGTNFLFIALSATFNFSTTISRYFYEFVMHFRWIYRNFQSDFYEHFLCNYYIFICNTMQISPL
jgi:hypothetical protein